MNLNDVPVKSSSSRFTASACCGMNPGEDWHPAAYSGRPPRNRSTPWPVRWFASAGGSLLLSLVSDSNRYTPQMFCPCGLCWKLVVQAKGGKTAKVQPTITIQSAPPCPLAHRMLRARMVPVQRFRVLIHDESEYWELATPSRSAYLFGEAALCTIAC